MADNNTEKPVARTIFISGEINEAVSKEVVERLIRFEIEDPNRDILVYVDSYGGSVDSLIAIHDAFLISRCDVATVCVGKAMSAGLLVLVSGEKGKRFITPNSRVLVHQLSGFNWGKLDEIENETQEFKRLQDILNEILRKRTSLNKSQIRDLLMKDSYLSAQQALEFGMVDYIVDKPKVLHSVVKI